MKPLTPQEAWFDQRKSKDMATPTIATSALKDGPKAVTVEMFKMRAVHGLLIHPDGTRFNTDKEALHVKDVWTGHQIEAKKLEIV